jgi:hypothetical protein
VFEVVVYGMRRYKERKRSAVWLVLKVLALVTILLCVGIFVLYEGFGEVLERSRLGMGWEPAVNGDSGGGLAHLEEVIGDVHVGGSSDKLQDDDEDEETLHPIMQLMTAAEKDFALLMGEQATSLASAGQKYRERRGRHPPPGFDRWYAYAARHDALVIESFFDQIYHDLRPFWGIDVYTLRRIAQTFSPKISVRKGTVGSVVKNSYDRMRGMVDMLEDMLGEDGVDLPDMDVPFNVHEEVGMLVDWDEVDTAVEVGQPIRVAPDNVIEDFVPVGGEEYANSTFDPDWLDARLRHNPDGAYYGPRPFWSLVRPACSPHSPARKEPLLVDIWDKDGHTDEHHSAAAMLPLEVIGGGLRGYVRNWAVASEVCLQPHLQGLHGGFVAPDDMRVTKKLFPLFSASKMGPSNEILVPSALSWNASLPSTLSWTEKKDGLYWRGSATGGRNSETNWQRFHRHRFVAMLNATHVEIAEGLLHAGNETMVGLGYAKNFRLLPANSYRLVTQKGGKMAEWVNSWANATFTDLHCNTESEGGRCEYTDKYFAVAPSSTLAFDIENEYKYAAVVDGNGGDDGGEFMTALRSCKVTLKASVYRQWYDSRVVPWVHFVPMDNTFVDLYGIIEFFLGTKLREGASPFAHAHVELPKHKHHFQTPHNEDDEQDASDAHRAKRREDMENGHDNEAQKIAEAGQAWAAKVLRKEDVSVYMYRLLLEYARVIDTRRERLGWVAD